MGKRGERLSLNLIDYIFIPVMVIARKPFENRQMRRLSVILLFVSLLLLILETFLLINLIIYAVKLEYKALLIIAGSLVLFCLIFTVVLILSSVFSIGKIQLQLLFGTAFVVILHLAILALIISWGIKSDQEFRGRVDRWNNSTNSMIENTTISTTTTSTTSTPATTTNILLNDTNGMIDHKIPFYFLETDLGIYDQAEGILMADIYVGDPGFSTTTRKVNSTIPSTFPFSIESTYRSLIPLLIVFSSSSLIFSLIRFFISFFIIRAYRRPIHLIASDRITVTPISHIVIQK